ncbi:MAG: hypothetical protein ACT4QF_15640 [Sporichthyaceae bacterium]
MAMADEADLAPSSHTMFPTVMRGYDRDAVEAVVRSEVDRFTALQGRISSLQRELAALSTAGDVPNRKRALRRALDLLSDGWDDALATTAETENAIGRERARAEGESAAHLRLTLAQCAELERASQAESDRLVAAAREQGKQMVARANAELDRAMALATDTTKSAALRGEGVTTEFIAAYRTLATEADNELRERQNKADFDLETAQAQLETARMDASAVMDRAEAQRQATLERARTQVGAIETANACELSRVQEETDRAVGELADLMAQANEQVSGADVEKAVAQVESALPEAARQNAS